MPAATTKPFEQSGAAAVPAGTGARADADARATIERFVRALGGTVDDVDLPDGFKHAADIQRTILCAAMTSVAADEYRRGADLMSEKLRGPIEHGQSLSAVASSSSIGRTTASRSSTRPESGWRSGQGSADRWPTARPTTASCWLRIRCQASPPPAPTALDLVAAVPRSTAHTVSPPTRTETSIS